MLRIEHMALDCTCKADITDHTAWLIVLSRTRCAFCIDGSDVEYPPNCIVLYKPGQILNFRACDEAFRLDYICFTTDEAYITGSGLPFGLPVVIADPDYYHSLFHLLAAEHANGGSLKEISMDKLMQVLFTKLSQISELKPKTHLCKSVHDLKRDIYSRPDEQWSLKLMANMLSISAGHLESTYKNIFGVSCMEDVIVSRITLAKKYLQNSTCSIAEVISRCGYRSAEHFYRQFKKVTGITPRGYRTKAQRMEEGRHNRLQTYEN